MRINKIGLVLSIVGIVAGAFMLFSALSTFDYSVYEGRVMFQETQEYTEFKQLLNRPEIQDWDTTVLSSEPPILVKFRVETDYNHKFPYGERTDQRIGEGKDTGFLIGGIVLLIFSPIGLILAITNEENKGG